MQHVSCPLPHLPYQEDTVSKDCTRSISRTNKHSFCINYHFQLLGKEWQDLSRRCSLFSSLIWWKRKFCQSQTEDSQMRASYQLREQAHQRFIYICKNRWHAKYILCAAFSSLIASISGSDPDTLFRCMLVSIARDRPMSPVPWAIPEGFRQGNNLAWVGSNRGSLLCLQWALETDILWSLVEVSSRVEDRKNNSFCFWDSRNKWYHLPF